MESPAGWYPDPRGDVTAIRYWDGRVWTEQIRSLAELDVSNSSAASPFVVGTPVQPPSAPPQPMGAPQLQPQLQLQLQPQPYMPLQPIYAPGQEVSAFASQQDEGRQGFAVAGLVLGILSFIFSCLAYLAIVPALLGIIFGALGIKSSRKGLAIAGLIMGVLGLLLGIGMTLLIILASSRGTSNPADYFESTFF